MNRPPAKPDLPRPLPKQLLKQLPKPQIDGAVSRAIDLLRFPLVVLVVYLHAFPMLQPLRAQAGLGFRLAELLAEQFARLAVPLLFVCAGYLFFHQYAAGFAAYLQMLGKKSRTLLLPFLVWSLFGIVLYAIGLSWQQTRPLFSNQLMLADFWSWHGFFSFWLGIERSPLVYPLWFVRDLLIFMLCSPLLVRLLLWFGWYGGGLLLLLWACQDGLLVCCELVVWPWFQPALASCTFFVVGALCALKPLPLAWLYRAGPYLLAAYLLGQLGLWFQLWPALPVAKLLLLIGVMALFYLALLLAQSEARSQRWTVCGAAAFFVFASHEPLLTVCRKVALAGLAPLTSELYIGLYWLLPLLVIGGLLACYSVLAATLPTCCQLLTGGRAHAKGA